MRVVASSHTVAILGYWRYGGIVPGIPVLQEAESIYSDKAIKGGPAGRYVCMYLSITVYHMEIVLIDSKLHVLDRSSRAI